MVGAGVGVEVGAGAGAGVGSGMLFSGVGLLFGFSGVPDRPVGAEGWETFPPAWPFSASSDPGFSSCNGSPVFAAGEFVDGCAVTDV